MGISIYLWRGAFHWCREEGFQRERVPANFRLFGVLTARRRVS